MQWGIRTTRRKILVAAGLLIVLFGLLFWGVASQRQRVEFADGLSLEWMGLTEGTNALWDGSLIEQMLGERIPAQGFDLGSLKLRRPASLRSHEEDAPLTAWIGVKGAGRKGNEFRFYWEGSKAITANSSGREIAIPPARPYRTGVSVTNETILRIPLYAFPRDERTVRLRVSPPADDDEERRWAEFEFENPFFGKVTPSWKAAALPITNVVGSQEFVLKYVRAVPPQVVFLMPSENWYAPELYIADEEGNRTARTGRRTRTNGREQTVDFDYGLEPNRIWKISATFVGASSKALMGFHDVDESDFPSERFLISLTAGGEAWLTNASGTKYRCRFDGKTVSIGKPGAREIPYFVVLGATNGADQVVRRDLEPMLSSALSWRSDGSERVQVWSPGQPCTNLVLHLALPEVVTTEFYVRPRQLQR